MGDEEVVYAQLNSGFDVSEGPTKADNGEDEPGVVAREAWDWDGAGTHQSKLSGWTNPLSWTDDANDDEGEGSTKVENISSGEIGKKHEPLATLSGHMILQLH